MKSEFEILERVRNRVVASTKSLKLGIGDDCAVFRPSPKEDLVFTTDFLIENVHFRRETHAPKDIGYKALARGLSDLAAMGATPQFCLLSLALPSWATKRFTDSIFDGLLDLGETVGCTLAGGDLAVAPLLVCDIVVCGSVPRGLAIRRDGAKPGDQIWISGQLGGSALGLAGNSTLAWQRHIRPVPRLSLGRYLLGKATAALDLSDGLSLDLKRLCDASGVAAEIVSPPVFQGATLPQALHGGEDYELLFTVPPTIRLPKLVDGVRLTRIGVVTKGKGIKLNGDFLRADGFDHFRSKSKKPPKQLAVKG